MIEVLNWASDNKDIIVIFMFFVCIPILLAIDMISSFLIKWKHGRNPIESEPDDNDEN